MSKIPFLNPEIVYREDFDDWAVLFDPDTAETYGLEDVGKFVWKQIDGKKTVEDIVKLLPEEFDGITEEAAEDVEKFLNSMEEKGLVGYRS